PVTVSVTPLPAAPTVSGTTICAGNTATLVATAPGGSYQWFDAASGGTLLATSTSYTTPALTVNTIYYVQTTVNGCPGPRTAVTVTVTPLPAAPTAPGTTICTGTAATLTATAPGGTYQWYDASTGGNLLGTSASYTTPSLTVTTTYYVQATVNSCTGPRTAVTVNVNPLPSAPTASGTTICSGSTATLTATAPGGTYSWYTASSGGTLVGTGASFTTPVLTATTTYYVETLLGCISSRTPVTVSVTPLPAAPTVSGTTICAGGTATLVATAPGGSYQWFNAPSGGTLLASGISYTTPALSSSNTYYVQTSINGCPGPRTAVTVTVTPLPAAPTASGITICEGNSTTINATAPGGTYQWFDSSSGGNLLNTGASYTTPVLISTTTYYVQTTVNGCASPRTAVTVTIIPRINPEFKYSSGTYCKLGDPVTPPPQIFNGPGTFSGPAGLIIDPNTGVINVALTPAGPYIVTYTSTSQCPSTTSATITISNAPDASFTYASPVCVGGTNPLPIFTGSGSAGVFSSTAGLAFVNTSTGEINLITSTPGTYTITNTISGAGCADVKTFQVIIKPSPAAPTFSGLTTICEGSPTTITANAAGATSYEWFPAATGGTAFHSSASYTTPNLSTTTTFYVQAIINGCPGPRTSVTINVTPKPAVPTASGTTICAGSATTLVATAPGGSYRWYDAPSGGTLLHTGFSYNTDPLTASTTFYVETTVNLCTSARTAVLVTVNPIPGAPTAPGANICAGETAALTASGSVGIYQWYDAAVGGNLIMTGPGFTTPVLNVNTNYYVQAINSGCPGPRTRVEVIVSPKPFAPTAAGRTICSGSTASLTATGSSGIYEWYNTVTGGTPLQTGSSFTSPVLTANTTYYVQSVVNGCVGPRTSVTVTVTPIPPAPTVSGVTICAGSTTTLTATAPGGIYRWYDTPTGGTALATGSSYTTNALITNTRFYVETTVNGCTSVRSPAQVTVTPLPAAPTAAGDSICAGTTTTLTASAPGGTYGWYDAAIGGNLVITGPSFTTPTLTATTRYYVQTTISGCPGPRTLVEVIVSPRPTAPSVAGSTICSGNTATLTATGPGGIYEWYDAASGGNLLVKANSFTTGLLTANTTYYVQSVVNGCAGPRASVTVTVTPLPGAPTASGTTICFGSTATLTATVVAGTYQWFDAPSGGSVLATGTSFSTPALTANATYYVQTTISGCPGPRTAVTVTVTPLPVAPTAPGVIICSGSSAVLTATAPGGIYEWYDAVSGGNLLLTGASFNTPILTANTTYYVQAIVNGCSGPRTAVTVTVTAIPQAPTAAGATICSGNAATLNATAPGGIYRWYDAPTGGNLLATANSFTSGALIANTIFYVQTTINGCTSPRTPVTVIVIPIPAAPIVNAPAICVGNSTTLTATGPGGNYQWYDAPIGGNLLQTGSSYTTPVLNTNTTFYVQTTINGCTSSLSAVTVITIPVINPEFEYSSGTYCKSGPAVTPAPKLYIAVGGTFSATPGLVFANANTGEINVAATPLGTYTITFTNNSQCPRISTANITITNFPVATFGYGSGSFCKGSSHAAAIFPPGASAGVFSASAGGLVFISASTGEINLSASTPGTYLVTNNITASGGCAAAVHSVSVTISSSPVSPTVSGGTTICAGNSTNLTAFAPGGLYEWFNAPIGGTLLATTATFTTPVLKTTTTYYVQSTINACTGPRSAVTVVVNPIIDPEFAYSSGTYCKSGIAVTPPPGIYTTGGGTFSSTTGLVFLNRNTGEIDVLASAIGTYTVSFTNNSPCPRVTYAKVTITNFPNATFSYGGPYCQGATNALPNFPAGASAGVFTSSSPALVFLSTSTGEIDLEISSPGNYIITNTIAANGGCALATYTSTVTIIAIPVVPGARDISICKGSNAVLAVSDPTGTYQWFDKSIGGMMVGTGDFFTTPALNSTTRYYVQAISNTCVSARKEIIVTVNSIPVSPVVVSNSPVCIGNSIVLGATYVPGATYTWEGPNNFTSSLQNPSINLANSANTGKYTVSIMVNGCVSAVSAVDVKINEVPIAIAGADQTLCVSTNAINLKGSVQGTSTTGIWSSRGTGTFSPSNTSLNAIYIPSSADKTALKVVLTLTSTNNVSCAPAISSMAVTLVPLPVVNAGADQAVCANGTEVNLSGSFSGASGGIWTSTGDGQFLPSKTAPKATYIPGSKDIKIGWAKLTMSSTGNGLCTSISDEVLITVNPLPKVSAGKDKVIRLDESITFKDTDADVEAQYLWTPAIGLDNYTVKNPVFSGTKSQTYTLTVTNKWGCSSSDQVFVKVLEPILIPNTFTPNGDGANDLWNIAKLKDYTEATVFIYNRYGIKLFHSQGYDQPWDGTYQGVQVPAGTYYYVIDTKMGEKFSGYILIVK
ncbi:gliding motility-associated C-terminal domain-containing protein, partial [Daejeonella sp.]|uniref:gliding motility-associated C-terminal domain-containing protein n=1 Tax=Daejeonella sp. TaxID=2805397 RepID=UPI0030BF26BE